MRSSNLQSRSYSTFIETRSEFHLYHGITLILAHPQTTQHLVNTLHV